VNEDEERADAFRGAVVLTLWTLAIVAIFRAAWMALGGAL
jgi:hypothetical protein